MNKFLHFPKGVEYYKGAVYDKVYGCVKNYEFSLTDLQIELLREMLGYAMGVCKSDVSLKWTKCVGNIVSFIITCGEVNQRLIDSKTRRIV